MSKKGIALTSVQLERFLASYNATILNYDDLPNYNNILDIFEDNDFRVIFVSSDKSDIGHWQLIINRNNTSFLFYDSFGFPPDAINKHLNVDPQNQSKEYIRNLISERQRLVSVNEQFQDLKSNNCGRFVLHRILAMKMSAKPYAEYMIKLRETFGDLDKHIVATISVAA